MEEKIKILIIEHDINDIEILLRELKKSDINYKVDIVENEQEFVNSLRNSIPDIILSDYSLPSFNGSTAFQIKQQITPDTPFIFVSGTIGEEKAVEHIKAGVTDYALKDKLFTLIPKIKRALREAEEKKAKKISDETLYKTHRLFAFISQVNQNIVRINDEKVLYHNSCNLAITYGKFKMAWIGLFDQENKTISLVEQCGLPGETLSFFHNAPYHANGPQHYILQNDTYYVCNDVERDLEVESWEPFATKYGIRSCTVLPIKKSGVTIGTLNLYSTEVNFFDKEEMKLLVEVATDISFAIDLFEKERTYKATESQIIKNEKRFRSLIEKSADMKTLSTLEGKFIYGSPSVTKVLGYSSEDFSGKDVTDFFHPGDIPDLIKNKTLLQETPGASFLFQYRLLHKKGHAIWCEGTLTNFLEESGINAFVSNFRDISERKKTEEEIINKNLQLKNLLHITQTIREEERTNVAREIHDELGQQLTALKMDIDWVLHKQSNPDHKVINKLNEMLKMNDRIINTVRRISSDLRPPIIDDIGLVATIEWKCADFEEKSGIECRFVSNIKERKYSKDFSIHLYRILQETLTNINRHAEATCVEVSLTENNRKELILEIHDNGIGITKENLSNRKKLGILGMKERAGMLKGELTITGDENQGTYVKLSLPLEDEYTNS